MKVLFISSSRLGDAILSTSVLHYLEKEYQNLSVTIACGELPAPLFEHVPFCKEIYILKKRPYALHWYDLWKNYRDNQFDKIIDLRGSIVSYFLKGRKKFIWKSKIARDAHQVNRFACLIEKDDTPIPPKLWLHKDALQKAKQDLPQRFLAVAPAANWIGKQWPGEKFAQLLQNFQKNNPNVPIVFFAAPHEAEIVEGIAQHLSLEYTYKVLTADLAYVTAALSSATVFVGNDSGLMHMAAALGVPTIGLFGPSNDVRYGPYGEGHHIIRGQSLSDIEAMPGFSYSGRDCYMEAISVEMVQEPLFNFWKKHHDATV